MPFSRGILKSNDNGVTYEKVYISNSGPQEVDLEISETDELYIAFSHDNLYKSGSEGENWLEILSTSDMWMSDLTIYQSTLYLGTENGLFISYDNGNSWDTTLTNTNILSVACNSQNRIFTSSRYGTKTSDDSGKTWQTQAYYFKKLFANKFGDILIGVDFNGIAYSLLEGETSWKKIEIVENMEVTSVSFDNANDKILIGTKQKGIIIGMFNRKN